ncbi:hypothetical protein FQV39_32220 (plasmid) [Bosea sp. F3-2]|uniref:hypothetical protein n=1 Tax=unclassified Bosea (in: a-proteobacteria) TaxID=2653178 RepID=UPI0011EE3AA6|nr:hypothetical protein [Bosea sp. F3-2]MCP4559564.1 hypothetical protein [Bosea sp. (in: a-proteobacteria)]MCP4738130.1 hypothetical protein [Bosea sp. (in: a-proteobacteria)]QEL27285.1 hypothetical protein FQV39_32220 [Bosea sp. F3-2]
MIHPDRDPPNDEQADAEMEIQCFLEATDELAALLEMERGAIIGALTIVIQKQAELERLKRLVTAPVRSRAR